MGAVPFAVVAEGKRRRIFLEPVANVINASARSTDEYVRGRNLEKEFPNQECKGTFASNAQGRHYCFKTFADYFSPRQLAALTTFSDLVLEARTEVVEHAMAAGMAPGPTGLAKGGAGAQAYGDALAVYLAFAVDRVVDRHSTIASWDSSPSKLQLRKTFAGQGIPMTWDYAEGNPFSMSSGTWSPSIEWVAKSIEFAPAHIPGQAYVADAASNRWSEQIVISTDPPYYNNIGYADLSDFFYIWLGRSLKNIFSSEFATVLVPKAHELVANPDRFKGGKAEAEAFFIAGMSRALNSMARSSVPETPVAFYYAFKQAEVETEGVVSTGWATFLEAVFAAGFQVDGTWPVRTELGNRIIGRGTNA